MSLKNFNEWVNSRKNVTENAMAETPEMKNARLGTKLEMFKKVLDSMTTLSKEDAEEIIGLLVPLIRQKAHMSASAALTIGKKAMAGQNEPTVGGAPGSQGK